MVSIVSRHVLCLGRTCVVLEQIKLRKLLRSNGVFENCFGIESSLLSKTDDTWRTVGFLPQQIL